MDFIIKQKPMDALEHDLALYPRLRLKLRTFGIPDDQLQFGLEKLFEAELEDNISLLYYG